MIKHHSCMNVVWRPKGTKITNYNKHGLFLKYPLKRKGLPGRASFVALGRNANEAIFLCGPRQH
jgi:hypothetical protein